MRQFKNSQTITERNTTSMTNYLHDLGRYPVISMDEEVRLARLIRQGGTEGEKAKEELIKANLRFVVSVANQYHQKNLELSDLVSEGNIGLIKAAERFDDTKGFKFISYAVWWIRQSIIAAISENGRMIRIPNNQQNLLSLYNQLATETMQTENRMPTDEEFAEFANIDESKVKTLMAAQNGTLSMDEPLGDDSDHAFGDTISSEMKTDDEAEKNSLHHDLIQTIRCVLQPRETEILLRSFGLNGPEQSIEEISNVMGLSKERVRQIKEHAIVKLKDNNNLLYKYLG